VIDASSALRVLDVANNHIGAKGGDTIAKALRTSTALETFICHDNPLQDDGCAAILRGLRENGSILYADLRSTGSGLISAAEATALVQGKSADFRLDLTS
jgi:Ran GTPase-activating protein (RanGAP) involved in mRNA processing and transport